MFKDTSMNVRNVDMPLINDGTFIYGMSPMVSHFENTIGIRRDLAIHICRKVVGNVTRGRRHESFYLFPSSSPWELMGFV